MAEPPRVAVWVSAPDAPRAPAPGTLVDLVGQLASPGLARAARWTVVSGAAVPRVGHGVDVRPARTLGWRWRRAAARTRAAREALDVGLLDAQERLAATTRRLAAQALPGGLPAGVAALLLVPPLLVALALLLLAERLTDLLVEGLLFPLGALDRQLRLTPWVETTPEADLWVVGPDAPPRDGPQLLVVEPAATADPTTLKAALLRATLVVPSTSALADELRGRFGVSPGRLRRPPPAPAGWTELVAEVQEVAGWPRDLHPARGPAWPAPARPGAPEGPPEVLLFLQEFAVGGILEASRDLVLGLAALAARRGQLRIRLAILDRTDASTCALAPLAAAAPLERFRLEPLTRGEARRLLGAEPDWLRDGPPSWVFFGGGAAEAALRADAWCALVDRFPLPLLAARPYAVVVYDVIQKFLPDVFDARFHERQRRGMTPSARGARLVVTTSGPTRADAIEHYGLDPARVRLAPMSNALARRLRGVTPLPVVSARPPFVLNVTNAAPHKGAERLLRGFARLRALERSRGSPATQLVMCGYGTDLFSPACPTPHPGHPAAMQALVTELGLQEPEEVLFLGFLDDAQLVDLFSRAAAVVNAALHDNGSFSLTEARWFGRPTASTRYPAVEFLCERFAIPARLFPPDDPEALARALDEALRLDAPLGPDELAAVRAAFEAPELSYERYVERVHDLLLELATEGRASRLNG